jgi:glyoxylase-like metal-dependent hydrolase (beta-lactamase superfamily II)
MITKTRVNLYLLKYIRNVMVQPPLLQIRHMADQLPSSLSNQAFFTVTPLEAGSLGLREHLFVSEGDPDKVLLVPSLSFLLRSSSSSNVILFDLGIKKDRTGYSPGTQSSLDNYFSPCKGDPDVVDSLKKQASPLGPKDITHVILSHIHW